MRAFSLKSGENSTVADTGIDIVAYENIFVVIAPECFFVWRINKYDRQN